MPHKASEGQVGYQHRGISERATGGEPVASAVGELIISGLTFTGGERSLPLTELVTHF
jgi:hypothetical protein